MVFWALQLQALRTVISFLCFSFFLKINCAKSAAKMICFSRISLSALTSRSSCPFFCSCEISSPTQFMELGVHRIIMFLCDTYRMLLQALRCSTYLNDSLLLATICFLFILHIGIPSISEETSLTSVVIYSLHVDFNVDDLKIVNCGGVLLESSGSERCKQYASCYQPGCVLHDRFTGQIGTSLLFKGL